MINLSALKKPSTIQAWIIAGAVITTVFIAYYAFTMPDKRNDVQKLGDAIEQLPSGIDKAARELENRTPAQKLNDAASDAANKLKNPRSN